VFWANLKSLSIHYAIGDCLPRSPGFYFGSVIFFIGVLLIAVGVSNVIAETMSLLTFVELISGVVLMIIGSRAIRSSQR
jgi:threonine/homoserine/homoserine lactone efflux protein